MLSLSVDTKSMRMGLMKKKCYEKKCDQLPGNNEKIPLRDFNYYCAMLGAPYTATHICMEITMGPSGKVVPTPHFAGMIVNCN